MIVIIATIATIAVVVIVTCAKSAPFERNTVVHSWLFVVNL